MEFTGAVTNIVRDWKTDRYQITFTVNETSAIREYEKIKDKKKLSVKAVPYRNKRSLDANAYAWVLMQKVAEAIDSDRWSVYLEMLKKYSREFTFVICKEKAVDRLKELYRTCVDLGKVNVNGMEGHQIQVFFGSSTFNSKAMAVFIDGIISECKELDIETMPQEEVERMLKQWNQ